MQDKPRGDALLRIVEGAFHTIPKMVREAYERDELTNSIWLMLHSRRVTNPSKLHVRSAAIDFHRMRTHYRRGKRHGDVFTRDFTERGPDGASIALGDREASVLPPEPGAMVDYLRELRRRFGSEGLTVFLLARVLDLPARSVSEILDYAPDSALAKSIGCL